MDSSPRHFLADLEDSDLAPWRALPPSKLLIQHLKAECERAKNNVAGYVETGASHSAAIATGTLRACESMLAVLHPIERDKPETEPEFVDPATIVMPRPRLKPRAFVDPATITNPGKKAP